MNSRAGFPTYTLSRGDLLYDTTLFIAIYRALVGQLFTSFRLLYHIKKQKKSRHAGGCVLICSGRFFQNIINLFFAPTIPRKCFLRLLYKPFFISCSFILFAPTHCNSINVIFTPTHRVFLSPRVAGRQAMCQAHLGA